jgi:hypothetical protein
MSRRIVVEYLQPLLASWLSVRHDNQETLT